MTTENERESTAKYTAQINFFDTPETVEAIDRERRKTTPPLTRSEVLRDLVARGLAERA